jgi:hypothetical protein
LGGLATAHPPTPATPVPHAQLRPRHRAHPPPAPRAELLAPVARRLRRTTTPSESPPTSHPTPPPAGGRGEGGGARSGERHGDPAPGLATRTESRPARASHGDYRLGWRPSSVFKFRRCGRPREWRGESNEPGALRRLSRSSPVPGPGPGPGVADRTVTVPGVPPAPGRGRPGRAGHWQARARGRSGRLWWPESAISKSRYYYFLLFYISIFYTHDLLLIDILFLFY